MCFGTTGFLACGGMVVGQRGQRLVGDYSERACADFRGLPTCICTPGSWPADVDCLKV